VPLHRKIPMVGTIPQAIVVHITKKNILSDSERSSAKKFKGSSASIKADFTFVNALP
jgi:hypothetical protein